MPSPVSKNHQKLITRVRKLFPQREVIGWPDSEVNLGHLCGLSNCNLRADIFVWWDEQHTRAVVIEYQSEIHTLKKANDWHDPDEIAGRDELKRELVSRLGAVLIEVNPYDMLTVTDEQLYDVIERAAEASWIETVGRDADGWFYRGKSDFARREFPRSRSEFKRVDTLWKSRSFENTNTGFKAKAAKLPGTRFKKKI